MAKYVFGIDLGTTYSCIAYVDETGRATVINNSEGTNTTPSVVNFASQNQVVVGQVAKENAVIDPQNTSSLVKTLLGKSDFAISYNGDNKSPEEVSAYILRKLTEDAAKLIDAEVKDVVITCPAYFGTAERTATKNAGTIAGLNVLEVISEPTAAALYYGCIKEHDEKTILVYDLGGGTFDVTIMRINADSIEVVCSDGNHELGGKDWDEAIMRYLASEFASENGFNGEFDEYAQQNLRLKAEKAKQQLSSREEIPVMLDAAGLVARINLSRTVFEEITASLLNQTIEKTDAAIAIAEAKGFKVDEIILVGGSTRMPQVTEALMEKYGLEPKVLEPDEAVAKGAAIHAVNVYIHKQKNISGFGDSGDGASHDENATAGVELEELAVVPELIGISGKVKPIIVATTKSFALKVLKESEEQCFNMIIKNEKMDNGAIHITRQFGTAEDNQDTAELVVYESDYMEEYYDVELVEPLGTASLELPGSLPAGAPIEVTFTLNTEGILVVTGVDMTSGKDVKVTMQSTGIMAQEKVEELKEKSRQVAVM
ncbi:MAG TPA: Hsp70 family protein [Candidatus Paenibacillus intestinavium]|nr:Hsp70 family protein [Candidatus Paenibacillus intestinavium]